VLKLCGVVVLSGGVEVVWCCGAVLKLCGVVVLSGGVEVVWCCGAVSGGTVLSASA